MKQLHTVTEPFVCGLVVRCVSIFPQSLLFPRLLVLSNPPSQAGNGRHFLEEIGEWRGSPGAASGFLYGCAIKRLMLYSLKLQRNKPTKYLSMDSVNEKNWIKRLYFHRPVEMEQPYTTAAPFVCALVVRCNQYISTIPSSSQDVWLMGRLCVSSFRHVFERPCIACGCFISTARWKYLLFIQFSVGGIHS